MATTLLLCSICAMITPFTGDEIYEAAKSMKNGKSSGIDDIHAEHIKYAPPSAYFFFGPEISPVRLFN